MDATILNERKIACLSCEEQSIEIMAVVAVVVVVVVGIVHENESRN